MKLLLAVLACVVLVFGCSKSESTTASSSASAATPATPAAPPADAMDLDAFRDKYGAGNSPKNGPAVKVHAYVENDHPKLTALVAKPGMTVPFVFCELPNKPAWVKPGVRVVAEGNASAGAIANCKLTKL